MSAFVRILVYKALSIVCAGFPLYVLSSGPVLALGFWLREKTGVDAFYVVLWLYYPLFAWGRDTPIFRYIEWWVVDVFHTVGPG